MQTDHMIEVEIKYLNIFALSVMPNTCYWNCTGTVKEFSSVVEMLA